MDLTNELKTNNNYIYCLDIIDHFSKWLFSYLLQDKSAKTIISKIKLYIMNLMNFGKCVIFQTDNGTEFKNNELKIFFENEGIKHIFSRAYHPQSQGTVEAVHKKVKKYLIDQYNNDKEKFNIETNLDNFIIQYNNKLNSVTNRKPIEIKDLEDKEEIDEINLNIIKSMARELKNELNVKEDDLLLLIDNIVVNKNTIKQKGKHRKNNYCIPCRFKSIINNNYVKIIVDVNYKNMLVDGTEYICEQILLIIVEDFAYNYYKNNFYKSILNDN